MGLLLTLASYLVTALFLGTYSLKALAWLRSAKGNRVAEAPPLHKTTLGTIALSAVDIVLLARLFRTNPGLWFGEWVFHVSFLFVILRHLRYVINPVPGWIWDLQTAGTIAGYLLPCSLIYVLLYKCVVEKKPYVSSYNFFLLFLLLFLSISGLMMKTFFQIDIIGVKYFVMGICTFMPAPFPGSVLFLSHYLVFLLFAVLLPTHVFAAPLVLIEARSRDEGLTQVIHDE